MIEYIQLILFIISSFGLGWAALQDYKKGQSAQVILGYINYHYAYIVTFILFVLSYFTYPFLPLLLIYLLILAFILMRSLGQDSKLAFALFAFSLLQQLALGHYSANPQNAFLFLSIWCFIGAFFMRFIGFSLIAPLLRSRYPVEERRHASWLRSKMNDVTYGYETSESMIKTIYQHNQNLRAPYTPATLAGTLIAYSIWSVLLTIVFFLFF